MKKYPTTLSLGQIKKSTFAWYSNVYPVFCKLTKDNSLLNGYASKCYEEGQIYSCRPINKSFYEEKISYKGSMLTFLTNNSDKNIYRLLYSSDDLEKAEDCSPALFNRMYLTNTYDGFLNYCKICEHGIHRGTNIPFFAQFKSSIQNLDTKLLSNSPDENFGFIKVKNQEDIGYYHFIIYKNIIIITDYSIG